LEIGGVATCDGVQREPGRPVVLRRVVGIPGGDAHRVATRADVVEAECAEQRRQVASKPSVRDPRQRSIGQPSRGGGLGVVDRERAPVGVGHCEPSTWRDHATQLGQRGDGIGRPLQHPLGAHEMCDPVARGKSSDVGEHDPGGCASASGLAHHDVRQVEINCAGADTFDHAPERAGAATGVDDDRAGIECDPLERPRPRRAHGRPRVGRVHHRHQVALVADIDGGEVGHRQRLRRRG
jgi:hypothetical protein